MFITKFTQTALQSPCEHKEQCLVKFMREVDACILGH